MENRNDIGKAFRDKLDGLQKSPPDALWNAIKADLPKKKNGFLTLFWGNVTITVKAVTVMAAALFVGFVTFMAIYNYPASAPVVTTPSEINNPDGNNTVTTTGTNANADSNNTSGNSSTGITSNQNSTSTGNANDFDAEASTANSGSSNTKATGSKTGVSHKNKRVNKASASNNNPDANADANNKGSKTRSGKASRNTHKTNTSAVADADNTATNNNKTKRRNSKAGKNSSTVQSGTGTSVAIAGVTNTKSGKNAKGKNSKNSKNSKNKSGKPNNALTDANDPKNHANYLYNKGTGLQYRNNKSKSVDSLLQVIDSVEAARKDTVLGFRSRGGKPPVTYADTTITANSAPKFYAFAHAAPTQYKFPDNESLLDASLNGNSTSVDFSFNYGAYIGYNLNDKWSIRAGVIRNKLEQVTKNASLFYTLDDDSIETNPTTNGTPPANYSGVDYAAGVSNESVLQTLGQNQEGPLVYNIKQKLEFIEVPLEATYNVFGNKAGLNIAAGVSTLFVTENSVYAQKSGSPMLRMGSVSGVNKVSFSGNLGLSFYYKLLPSLQINAEPIFKYYFNTVDNVNPYSFGAQIGLQYNFNF